jgi:hypothetical protein
MTTKHLRVLLAAGLLLALCGGCFGNCVTDISDTFFGGLGGTRTYYDLVEADAGPSDAVGDAGVE